MFERSPDEQISLVTRSGENRFHGLALAYLLQTSFLDETSALLMISKSNGFPLSIGASRWIVY
jgi:hypothetical protein